MLFRSFTFKVWILDTPLTNGFNVQNIPAVYSNNIPYGYCLWSAASNSYPFFNFYTKSKFNDQKFPSLLGKKSFSELPQDFVLEIFKDYIQHLLFVNNYLENYNKNEYIGVPFQTIMFDEKNLINLLEQITETKATESVIKTIQKYQTVQIQLQKKFPEFFNIK